MFTIKAAYTDMTSDVINDESWFIRSRQLSSTDPWSSHSCHRAQCRFCFIKRDSLDVYFSSQGVWTFNDMTSAAGFTVNSHPLCISANNGISRKTYDSCAFGDTRSEPSCQSGLYQCRYSAAFIITCRSKLQNDTSVTQQQINTMHTWSRFLHVI